MKVPERRCWIFFHTWKISLSCGTVMPETLTLSIYWSYIEYACFCSRYSCCMYVNLFGWRCFIRFVIIIITIFGFCMNFCLLHMHNRNFVFHTFRQFIIIDLLQLTHTIYNNTYYVYLIGIKCQFFYCCRLLLC